MDKRKHFNKIFTLHTEKKGFLLSIFSGGVKKI